MRAYSKLPDGLTPLVEKEGLDTKGIYCCVEGDMDKEGAFCSSWLFFDDAGVYIATGAQRIKKAKGSKRIENEYTLHSLECIPVGEIKKIKTEQYISTAALIAETAEGERLLTKFSLGNLPGFNDFAKAFSVFKEGGDVTETVKQFKGNPYCPKCGERYPDSREVCPNCMDKSSVIKRLFSFFSDYKWKVMLIIVTMLMSTVVNIYAPQVSTRSLIDDVLADYINTPVQQVFAAIGSLVLTILAVKLLNLLFTVIQQYITAAILPWVIYDIKLKIFEAMQRLTVGFYSAKQTGSLMERVNRDSNNIYWFMMDGLPYVITSGSSLIGVIIIMFVMEWRLAIIALVTLPVIVVMFRLADRVFRRLHHKSWAYNAKVSATVSDNINGQRIIKAFAKEQEEYDRFSVYSGKLRDAETKLESTDFTIYPLIYAGIYFVTAVITAIGGIMVVRGEMSLGMLMSFTVYLGMLNGPLEFFSWVSNWWARCIDSAQRMFEIIDTTPDVVEKEDPVIIGDFKGALEIKELEFEYEPARPVIKKLDLSVPAGQMLGIVGKTGAGKTTIANLIARLYEAKAGSITIDGVDVKDISFAQLRSNVGIVSQEIYLFMGTIADNIRYAKPNATFEEVVAAAKAASAHEFIMKLPDAYQTRVGAGGQDLSGGERQRISIARTIIQNPKILILDEATAAMDTKTEQNIQEALTKLKDGRTTLAIAHRLSTLRDADMLAVIDKGKVVEYGSYVELMSKKGEYYKLYKMQSEALKQVGIAED